MKNTKMVYATKYALTKGIEYLEVKESTMENLVFENKQYGRAFHQGEWFENKADAIKDAEKRKDKKIKSLEKQLLKFMQLKF